MFWGHSDIARRADWPKGWWSSSWSWEKLLIAVVLAVLLGIPVLVGELAHSFILLTLTYCLVAFLLILVVTIVTINRGRAGTIEPLGTAWDGEKWSYRSPRNEE
jgi:hypothetical protein